MSAGNKRFQSAVDPHGYEPLIVDEDCLSDSDRRQAVIDAVAHPRDWSSQITPQEWAQYDREVAELERLAELEGKNTPSLFYGGEPRGLRDKEQELMMKGSFRAYARQKYGTIWYGDGVPWLR